ncbi:MAG TPA: TolC family protein [Acidobacteriota bacterium]|nr:TolC family protein [Acidobacteriota bacterium]
MRPLWAVILIASALAPGLSARGEEPLTLEKAVEIALARNPKVLEARAGVEASRGRTLQLRSRPEPGVVASLEGIPIPGLKKDGDGTEVSLGIEQVFEYPGKRSLRAEIGRQGEDLAQSELDRVRLLLASQVKKNYWRAAFSTGAVAALERSASRLDALLENVQAKYQTGSATFADVLRVRAEKARLRNQILDQSKERRMAELNLNELLARPPSEPIELLTSLPFNPLAVDPAALLETARVSLPSFRVAALRMERAGSAIKLADLGRRPDFLAGLLLPSVRPNAWGVSFGLTMPFLRPGRAKGAAMEAHAEAESSRLASEALDRRVETAIKSAFAAAKSAEEQVRVYERSLLTELEEELGIQLEYFRYGKVEAYSLLDLYRTYVLAQVEHLRALLLYNLALADLEVAGEETE